MLRFIAVILISLSVLSFSFAQESIKIELENPSFEDVPRSGQAPKLWSDCGSVMESPVDIQPGGGFNVTREAVHGNTYLGLVTRDTKTFESVGQRLSTRLKKGQCYKVSLFACKSPVYLSTTRGRSMEPVNFNKGCILRIWGGNSPCSRLELLDETPQTVDHTDWRKYTFNLKPQKSNYSYIVFEVHYKTPTIYWYNGNMLIDNLSSITSCNMPDEDTLIAAPVLAVNDTTITTTNITEKPKTPKPNRTKEEPNLVKVEDLVRMDKGNFDLAKMIAAKPRPGDVYRLNKLLFPADSARITRVAEGALVDLHRFLQKNSSITIEIGGHTNGLPSHSYCDNLSSARAQNVASYLIKKGIKKGRIRYKGYGKRKPVADNTTAKGRRMNQRVELTILTVN
jgi:outer membrane protein OmpA-like peptidoglycan-associated protein